MADMTPMAVADIGDLIPVKYDKTVLDDKRARELFAKMEGAPGTLNPVIAKMDLTKEPGDRIHIEVISELFKPGVSAETELRGTEEKFQINRFTVPTELYRHGVGITWKANKQALIDAIIRAGPKLSRWMANEYDAKGGAELLSPTNASAATFYAGGANATSELSSTCRMSPDEFDKLNLVMKRRGAKHTELLSAKRDDMIEIFILIMSLEDWYWLQKDTAFRNTLKDSLPRGYDHPLLTGAKGMYNGIVIRVHPGIHQGCHQGTFQRPEVEITTQTEEIGQTTLSVGSASTGYDYTRYFPQGSTFTAEIYADGTNATETITTVACSANNYELTCDATGIQHLVGSRIAFQNHRSQCLCLGAESLARAWCTKDMIITNTEDYGMDKGVGVLSFFGQAVIEDSAGNVPNFVILETYADLPNLESITI